MKKLYLLLPLLLALLACNLSVASVTPTVGASSAPTNASLPPTPQSSLPQDATVTGRLSYPSEFIPPMRVALFSLTDGKVYYVDTAKDQGTYSLVVPAGQYYVVSYPYEGIPGTIGIANSYTLGGGPYAGGYTQMVPCGLTAECTDHTLIPITVEKGQTITADPGDWYAPEGTFPPMPSP